MQGELSRREAVVGNPSRLTLAGILLRFDDVPTTVFSHTLNFRPAGENGELMAARGFFGSSDRASSVKRLKVPLPRMGRELPFRGGGRADAYGARHPR